MKTLVVYDSVHGNTEQIAESIGSALSGQTRVLHVTEVTGDDMKGMELLIVGSPTHGGKATKAITDFLSSISPSALAGATVAAFDTRLPGKLVGIFGFAAGKIMAELSGKGGIGIEAPEGFVVGGRNGPLQPDERERAAKWAKALDKQDRAASGTTPQGSGVRKRTNRAGIVAGIFAAIFALAMCGPLVASYGAALSDFESHPDPVADYSVAVQKVAGLRAAEVGLSPDAHTILLTHGAKTERAIVLIPGMNALPSGYDELAKRLFDMGYNVLSVALPYQGLEDRMTTRLAEVRYEDWVSYADAAVDIGHGLGAHLTVAGISLGGLITGWVAQQRPDVDSAVLISPGYAFKIWPEFLDSIMGGLFTLLPNMFLWENNNLKADYPAYYGYPRFPTRAVVQIIRFHAGLKDLAKESAPAAKDVIVVTNAGDGDVDNTGTDKVVANWRKHGARITTHEFSKDLHVGHDLIDPRRPDARIEAIYPVLLELIDK